MTITLQEEMATLGTPNHVHLAVCEKSEVIPPLQYYSQEKECIYVLDYSSHRYISKLFLHFDPAGTLIAHLIVGEYPEGTARAHIAGIKFTDLQHFISTQSKFAECLLDMHIYSTQNPTSLYDENEMDQLKIYSRYAPVIIGGCGRSGTTLLLSILGAHPAILAFPDELYAFYPKPFRLHKLLNAIEVFGKAREWRRWCEKTPKNVRAFADINRILDGQVKLLHIVRDGRDVVTSHHPNDTSRYYISPERWVADVRDGLNNSDNVHLVRYEDLVRDPRSTLLRVCEYLDEDYDNRLLSFAEVSTVKENKAWKEHKILELYTSSLNRWQLPENEERVDEFMKYPGAVELMRELHYM